MNKTSEVMEDLGYGSQERNYHLQREKLSMTSKSSSESGPTRSKPPLIIPEKMPEEIMGDDKELVKRVLVGHRASGMQWDDYAKKFDGESREILARIFFESRCNGFYGPRVFGDKIHHQQALKMTNTVKKHGELTVAAMRGAFKPSENELDG